MTEETGTAMSSPNVTRNRSPNHPAFGLEEAEAKTAILYDAYQCHSVPMVTALQKLGLKSTSSSGMQALAALSAFGLIEVTGAGVKRHVKVSEDAAKIVGGHRDKQTLRQAAAIAPNLHKELWDRFHTKDGLAPDETISHYLRWDRAEGTFIPQALEGFIEQFKNTVRFAKLDSSAKISGGADNTGGDGDTNRDPPPLDPNALRLEGVPKVPQGSKQDVFAVSGAGQLVVQWPASLTPEDIEDIEGWWPIVLRKIKRCVSGDAPAPSSLILSAATIDVSDDELGEEVEDGVYRIQEFVEGADYRETANRRPIMSIGRNKETGEMLAAVDARFYQNPEYECIWLR